MAVKKIFLILLAFFFVAAGSIVRAESEITAEPEQTSSIDEQDVDTSLDEPYDSITWEDVLEDEKKPAYEAHFIRHERDEDGNSQILTATTSRESKSKTLVVLDT